ncbi:PAS domain-containing sensor histidine kinase [Halorientalis pallida]|uniref:histidine kinase n=1 Tax=Halorientalis pallida TaxID=2479928 RepID=A0A498KX16_9EURY|nr:PAS domain-containing sensor histidine kinase [Halorientalis pallida]RXK50171.1 PAS domain-containing sensor histidine kinase [Halorientalis pallida]
MTVPDAVDGASPWQQRLLARDLVGVCIVQDGAVVHANEALGDLLGVPAADLSGQSFLSFVDEADRERVETALAAGCATPDERREYTCTMVRAGGTERAVELHGTTVRYEGAPAAMEVVLGRIDRETDTESLYRAIVESSRDIAYVYGPDGRTELVNQRVTEFTGIPVAALEGTYLLDFASVVDAETFARYADAVEAILTGDRTDAAVEMESEIGSRTVTGEHRLTPLERDGQVEGVVGIARDVTKRKERERQLSELKQVLTRVMRHNLRNDINVIRACAELLADSDDEEVRDLSERIVEKCNSLTDTSQKATRIERAILRNGDVTETDVGDLVTEIAARADRNHPDATVERRGPASVTAQAHDDVDLAIQNLVENAVKHNDGPDPWVGIDVERDARTVTVRVADDGPGIAPEEVAILERREETALEHGSGAGLWLAATVANASGGGITVDRTDRGTEAILRLPTGKD